MKLGLFSVGYAGLWGQAKLELPAFLDKAADLGFTGVLLMAKRPHLSILDADGARLDAIKAKLAQRNLSLIGLAAYDDFLVPAPGEVPVNEFQVACIEECARITARLGGSLVRVFTGYERSDLSLAAQWDRVIACLQECADRAARYGVQIVVQNHHDLGVETRSFELLLGEVDRPNIRAGYDAWSPFLRGENLYEGAKRMAPRTGMSIVADYIRLTRYKYRPDLVNYLQAQPEFVRATLPGTGEVDYRSFFKGLKDGGFDGWAVYEMCSPLVGGGSLENLDRHSREFLHFMRGMSL